MAMFNKRKFLKLLNSSTEILSRKKV